MHKYTCPSHVGAGQVSGFWITITDKYTNIYVVVLWHLLPQPWSLYFVTGISLWISRTYAFYLRVV
jgi:hypothetical protein